MNPAVIQAALFGQLSFSWAATMLLFGIAAWRQETPVAAVLLVGLAQATHPAVVVPLAALLVLGLVAVRTATPPVARVLRARLC